MRRILRYTVPADGQPHEIPADVLHVATRNEDAVEVWAWEKLTDTDTTRTVRVVGTGHPVPADARHVGSAVTPTGRFVWHLIELPEDTTP